MIPELFRSELIRLIVAKVRILTFDFIIYTTYHFDLFINFYML